MLGAFEIAFVNPSYAGFASQRSPKAVTACAQKVHEHNFGKQEMLALEPKQKGDGHWLSRKYRQHIDSIPWQMRAIYLLLITVLAGVLCKRLHR
jgi:hypothetical protein